MNAIQLATLFHEIYERRAPEFGYETRPETREFKPDTPNGKLMIAVCDEILDKTADLKHVPEHTALDDFEHFLSYSGLRDKHQDIKSLMWKAFEAAW